MKSLLHACRVIAGLEAPASQVTARELECLLKHSQAAQTIVEIGCFEGSTTLALAKDKSKRVYSIDPFFPGRLGLCYGEAVAKSLRWRRGLRNIKFLKGYSYQVAPTFASTIDFIFIDADHSYEAVKRDWSDWFPKLKPGGIIALHDCRLADNSPGYLGSMKFYEEDIPTITGIKQIDAIDSLVVLQSQIEPSL